MGWSKKACDGSDPNVREAPAAPLPLSAFAGVRPAPRGTVPHSTPCCRAFSVCPTTRRPTPNACAWPPSSPTAPACQSTAASGERGAWHSRERSSWWFAASADMALSCSENVSLAAYRDLPSDSAFVDASNAPISSWDNGVRSGSNHPLAGLRPRPGLRRCSGALLSALLPVRCPGESSTAKTAKRRTEITS